MVAFPSNVNNNKVTTGTPVNTGGVQNQTETVEIQFNTVATPKIPDEDLPVMRAKGYTPETWLALTEQEREQVRQEHYGEHTQTSDAHAVKPKVVIQLPDNWKELSVKEKQNFLFNEYGRAYVENWDSLSSEQKAQIIEEQLEALCQKVDPQFQYMNAKDKEKSMEMAYVIFGVLVEKADPETIGNGGLAQAYETLNAGSKREIGSQMRAVAKELGLNNISEQDKIRFDDNKAVREFHSLEKGRPNDKQRLEYYRHLLQQGQELNEYQQREYDILIQKEELDPSSMVHSHRDDEGEAITSIEEAFSFEGSLPYIENKKGLLDIHSDTNRERLISNLTSRFGNTSGLSDDDAQLKTYQTEIAEIYNGLSAHERNFFLNTILRNGNMDRRLFDGIKDTAGRVIAANDENVASEVRSEEIKLHTTNVAMRRKNGEDVETQGFYDYVNRDENHFDNENKSDLQVSVLENGLGEQEVDKAQRSLKENCSDYMTVFELTDGKVNQSDKISDDMKQYYAQNSIEIMDNDADRQARSNSLYSYNNDSFNRGVQKGYENIANGTASGSSSSAQNNATNPITNGSQNVQILSPNTQQVYNNFNNSQDGKPISHEQAVRMFQRLEPNEQKDFLTSLTPQQVSQIPITVCNAFPELIGTFIDLGKGIDIIQQCNVNTGNRTIQIMAKSKGASKKQFNEWAANHLDRLAKSTYDNLVDSGAIKVDKNNKSFAAKG